MYPLQPYVPDPRLLAEEFEPVWIFFTDEDWHLIRDLYLRHTVEVTHVSVQIEHLLIRAMTRQLGTEVIARRVLYSGKIIAWGFILAAATPAAEPIRTELTILSWTSTFIVPIAGTATGWMIRQAYPWLAQIGGWERITLALRSNAIAAAFGVSAKAAGGSILPIAVVAGRTTAPYAADALLTALSKIPSGVSSFSQLIATTRGRAVALEIAGAFLKEAVQVTIARAAVPLRVVGSIAFRALGATFADLFRSLPIVGNLLLFFDAFNILKEQFALANVQYQVERLLNITTEKPFEDYLTCKLFAHRLPIAIEAANGRVGGGLDFVANIYDLARAAARTYIRRTTNGIPTPGPTYVLLASYEAELMDAVMNSVQVPVIPIPRIEAPAPAPVRSPIIAVNSNMRAILPITQNNFPQQPQAVRYIALVTFGPPQYGEYQTYPQYVIDQLNSMFQQMPTQQQLRQLPNLASAPAPTVRPRPQPTLSYIAVPVGGNRWTLMFNQTPIRTYNSRKTARTIGKIIYNQISGAIKQKAPAQIDAVIIYDILLAWTDPNVVAPASSNFS